MIKINQAMTKKKIINSGRKNKIIIILKSAKKIKKNKIVNENLTLITLLIIQISRFCCQETWRLHKAE